MPCPVCLVLRHWCASEQQFIHMEWCHVVGVGKGFDSYITSAYIKQENLSSADFSSMHWTNHVNMAHGTHMTRPCYPGFVSELETSLAHSLAAGAHISDCVMPPHKTTARNPCRISNTTEKA